MRWIYAPLLTLACLIATDAAAQSPHPAVWFLPTLTAPDWQQLFADHAPWQNARRQVSTISVVHWWLRRSPVSDVTLITNYTRRHHLKFNMESEVIAKFQNQTCGGMEGYTYEGELLATVQILKAQNIHLDSITMDSPLWFGHYDTDPGACNVSVDDLISRVVLNLTDILSVYPGVEIVWIEPLGIMSESDWQQTMLAFKLGVEQQLGVRLATMQMDVDGSTPGWQSWIPPMHTWLHQQNMAMGIYYDGTALDTSDAGWVNDAVSHFETVEGVLGIHPDQAIFATWYPYPSLNLPETADTTMTWLIDRYELPYSELQVHYVGAGAAGTLTTDTGKAIAGATVNGYVPGTDLSQPLPVYTATGVVPPGATSALIGVRLNTECNCAGLNDVLLGTVSYQETQGGNAAAQYAIPNGYLQIGTLTFDSIVTGGVPVTRIIVPAATAFAPNGSVFPVTAGATYRFNVPAGTIGGVGWYGNVILVWLGANGEISRVGINPGPGTTRVGSVTTAADGTFALPYLPRDSLGGQPVTVYFDGGGTYRSVTWSPFR
jgi:hypothetical protein